MGQTTPTCHPAFCSSATADTAVVSITTAPLQADSKSWELFGCTFVYMELLTLEGHSLIECFQSAQEMLWDTPTHKPNPTYVYLLPIFHRNTPGSFFSHDILALSEPCHTDYKAHLPYFCAIQCLVLKNDLHSLEPATHLCKDPQAGPHPLYFNNFYTP